MPLAADLAILGAGQEEYERSHGTPTDDRWAAEAPADIDGEPASLRSQPRRVWRAGRVPDQGLRSGSSALIAWVNSVLSSARTALPPPLSCDVSAITM